MAQNSPPPCSLFDPPRVKFFLLVSHWPRGTRVQSKVTDIHPFCLSDVMCNSYFCMTHTLIIDCFPVFTLKHGCPSLLPSCQSWANTTNTLQSRQNMGVIKRKLTSREAAEHTAFPTLNSHHPLLISMCTWPMFQQRGSSRQ